MRPLVTNENWRNRLIHERIKQTGASKELVAWSFASCEISVEARLWSEFCQARLFEHANESMFDAGDTQDDEVVWVAQRFAIDVGSITWMRVHAVLGGSEKSIGRTLVDRWRTDVRREFDACLNVHRIGRTRRP